MARRTPKGIQDDIVGGIRKIVSPWLGAPPTQPTQVTQAQGVARAAAENLDQVFAGGMIKAGVQGDKALVKQAAINAAALGAGYIAGKAVQGLIRAPAVLRTELATYRTARQVNRGNTFYHAGMHQTALSGDWRVVYPTANEYLPVHLRKGDPNFHAGTFKASLERPAIHSLETEKYVKRPAIDRYVIKDWKRVLPGYVDESAVPWNDLMYDKLNEKWVKYPQGQTHPSGFKSPSYTTSARYGESDEYPFFDTFVPATPAEIAKHKELMKTTVQQYEKIPTPENKILMYKNVVEDPGKLSVLIPKELVGKKGPVVYAGSAIPTEAGSLVPQTNKTAFLTPEIKKAIAAEAKIQSATSELSKMGVAAGYGAVVSHDVISKKKGRGGGKNKR